MPTGSKVIPYLRTGNLKHHILSHGAYCSYMANTVEPLKQPPIQQPTFIWQPAAKVLKKLYTIPCNENSHLCTVASVSLLPSRGWIFFHFIPLLIVVEDLKVDVFSQMKVKEWQCGNVIIIVPLAFLNVVGPYYSYHCSTILCLHLFVLFYLIKWKLDHAQHFLFWMAGHLLSSPQEYYYRLIKVQLYTGGPCPRYKLHVRWMYMTLLPVM